MGRTLLTVTATGAPMRRMGGALLPPVSPPEGPHRGQEGIARNLRTGVVSSRVNAGYASCLTALLSWAVDAAHGGPRPGGRVCGSGRAPPWAPRRRPPVLPPPAAA